MLICDEAVSALDVSTQAAIICTLEDLQDRLGLRTCSSPTTSPSSATSATASPSCTGGLVETGAADDGLERPAGGLHQGPARCRSESREADVRNAAIHKGSVW